MGRVHEPLEIGGTTKLRNRLYRAPVLEGAGSGPDAAERYAEAFVPNARAGVGLVIQGSACLYGEGRTSPGMTLVHTRERVLAMAPMVDAVHDAGAAIWLQVGHGGLYAMEAWHEPYASQRRGPVLAPSRPPLLLRAAFRGVPVHVMTTAELFGLAEQYGRAAAWAREAGYDGVQLGAANAKLLDQILSPFYNQRDDEFGGSVVKRARILVEIRNQIAEQAGDDFTVSTKIPSELGPPLHPHATADDALELCRMAEDMGYDAITPVEVSVFPDTSLSRGGVPSSLWKQPGIRSRFRAAAPKRSRRLAITAGSWIGGRRHPFEPVWNRSLFAAAKARVEIPVFAVGGIRTAEEVEQILAAGEADAVGIGRPFYAEPDLPARILGGTTGPGLCRNSNHCVPPQMLGMKGVCYNPEVRRLKGATRDATPE